jgi:DNA-binding MarR family transcriptional regulator
MQDGWRALEITTHDRLIYQLFMAQQKLRTYIKNAFVRKGLRVTLGQVGILFLLKQNDGQTMTELSQVMGIDNSTLTGLIDRLERSGLVTRKPSPTDRRMYRIHITPEGVSESDKAKPVIKGINEEIKSGLSNEEIELFKRVLMSLSQRFGKP